MLERGGVGVQWSSLHVPERDSSVPAVRMAAHFSPGGRKLGRTRGRAARHDGRHGAPGGRAGDRSGGALHAELDDRARARATAIVHTVEGGHVLSTAWRSTTSKGAWRGSALSERGVASLTLAHLFPHYLAGHTEGDPGEPGPAVPDGPKVD